jgi:hypothetical protein
MKNLIYICFGFLLFIIGCEDEKQEPEPTGILGITMDKPGITYIDEWWDYATKYEIYVDDVKSKTGSFSGFEVTNVETTPGAHQVAAVLTADNGNWLFSVQKSATVQEDFVTEVVFGSWYSTGVYPPADYFNYFDGALSDFVVNQNNFTIQNSKLFSASMGNQGGRALYWQNQTQIQPEMRISLIIESSFVDTNYVSLGVGSSATGNYYVFWIQYNGYFITKYTPNDGWTTIASDYGSGIINGNILLVCTETGYIHCYYNGNRELFEFAGESFDIVRIAHIGKSDAFFDNLLIWGNNINVIPTFLLSPENHIPLPSKYTGIN